MTPGEIAAEVPSVLGFGNDLRAHLRSGLVVSEPEFFIMLRPVRKGARLDLLLNPWWSDWEGDTWYIWLLAGNGRAALDFLVPRYGRKNWLAFQSGDFPPVWIKFNRIEKLWQKAATVRR